MLLMKNIGKQTEMMSDWLRNVRRRWTAWNRRRKSAVRDDSIIEASVRLIELDSMVNDGPQPNPDDADVRKLNEVDSALRRNADILRLQAMNSDNH